MTNKSRIEALITKLEKPDYFDCPNTSKEYLVLCCGWKAKYKRGPSGQLGPIEGPAGEPSRDAGWPTHVLQDALDSLPENAGYNIVKPDGVDWTMVTLWDEKCGAGEAISNSAPAAICIANLRRILEATKS